MWILSNVAELGVLEMPFWGMGWYGIKVKYHFHCLPIHHFATAWAKLSPGADFNRDRKWTVSYLRLVRSYCAMEQIELP